MNQLLETPYLVWIDEPLEALETILQFPFAQEA